jgi:hypothetical protein
VQAIWFPTCMFTHYHFSVQLVGWIENFHRDQQIGQNNDGK